MEPTRIDDFSALQDLPDAPPGLRIGGDDVVPYSVDWKVRSTEVHELMESPEDVPQMRVAQDEMILEVGPSALPSRLSLGYYVGGISDIDPALPPGEVFDCVVGDRCLATQTDEGYSVDIGAVLPDVGDQFVIVLTATYFAEADSVPYANSVSWVLDLQIGG